jgi:hypothetical protein
MISVYPNLAVSALRLVSFSGDHVPLQQPCLFLPISLSLTSPLWYVKRYAEEENLSIPFLSIYYHDPGVANPEIRVDNFIQSSNNRATSANIRLASGSVLWVGGCSTAPKPSEGDDQLFAIII